MNNSNLENICYLCKVPDKYCKCNSVKYSDVSTLLGPMCNMAKTEGFSPKADAPLPE